MALKNAELPSIHSSSNVKQLPCKQIQVKEFFSKEILTHFLTYFHIDYGNVIFFCSEKTMIDRNWVNKLYFLSD